MRERHKIPEGPNRVLLVDDEASVIRIVGDILVQAGYEVGIARNGSEGLQKFLGGHWDAVIADKFMPGMDGEEMTSKIKADQPEVPVILITGLPESIKHSTQYDAILAKPFRRKNILMILESLCPAKANPERH